ncbi:MAG: hypothetical protein C4547_14495 [Phycisphaerales bacterium]|nr:MAG: hypothetical protein C4547_14495 [Phycisphaerales bacterium]
MITKPQDCDVFLCFSIVDAADARRVRAALENAELKVYERTPDERDGERVAQALAACDALVVIVPVSGDVSANSLVEMGAAWGWGKPMFGVRYGNGHAAPAGFLTRVKLFPPSRLDDLVSEIKRTRRPISRPQREALAAVYAELGTSTDEMVRDPLLVDRFVERFKERTGRSVGRDRLVNELLRLRKSGVLPRLGRKKRGASRPRVDEEA